MRRGKILLARANAAFGPGVRRWSCKRRPTEPGPTVWLRTRDERLEDVAEALRLFELRTMARRRERHQLRFGREHEDGALVGPAVGAIRLAP
jgi:hypothetical protein